MGWSYLVIQGDLTIGQLIAFRITSGYVVGPLLNLATSWQSFQGVALSMERLSDVVDTTVRRVMILSLISCLFHLWQERLSFEDVEFRFRDGSISC